MNRHICVAISVRVDTNNAAVGKLATNNHFFVMSLFFGPALKQFSRDVSELKFFISA